MNKIFLLFFFLVPITVTAQDSLRIGTKYAFLPEVRFNSDDGIFVGGELQTYNYGNGELLPFKNFSKTRLNYKTNGAFTFSYNNDVVDFLGSEKRFFYEFFSNQNFANYFFGDTDEQDYNKALFDSTSFYNFKSFKTSLGGFLRNPISKGAGLDRFDFKAGLNLVYETPWGNPENRFIGSNKIEGEEGAFLAIIDLGLILERRNSEFIAQEGYLIDIGSRYSPPLISTHHTVENYLKILGFVPLSKRVPTTLAARLNFQNTVGETPYWFTPFLGGSGTLRGFIYRRFTSDNALSYSLELRSWLVKIPYKQISLGGHLFVDGGRVFANDNWKSILSKHNHALGFGGVMSIFSPDYILKYEMAFSKDGIGVYLGSGYSF